MSIAYFDERSALFDRATYWQLSPAGMVRRVMGMEPLV
jgi:hypothetical protein